MAVLVNAESISAAEFFAAALREYEWAVLVGSQTQGKGHYQETHLLSDGFFVAGVLLGGSGVLAYIICAIVMPDEPSDIIDV